MPETERNPVVDALSGCTKQDLLELLRPVVITGYVTERGIKRIQADRIVRKARRLSDEALAEMKRHSGNPRPAAVEAWTEASRKFDRAMALYDKADLLRLEP